MRAVVWINESRWEDCVDAVPDAADVTFLHVTPGDVEALMHGHRLGHHRAPPPPGPDPHAVAGEAAEALLADAAARLGRPARTEARSGRAEDEVIAAAEGADLLVLARDGEPHPGPKSLSPPTRFVVDHATCAVLLV
jgi:nucleotide-binding universal stress UspA family protein